MPERILWNIVEVRDPKKTENVKKKKQAKKPNTPNTEILILK